LLVILWMRVTFQSQNLQLLTSFQSRRVACCSSVVDSNHARDSVFLQFDSKLCEPAMVQLFDSMTVFPSSRCSYTKILMVITGIPSASASLCFWSL
jgi:hypothetical protein